MPDRDQVAADFGYTLAFFDGVPELKRLLDRAVAGTYTSSRFVAELQNTSWFRTNGETARRYYVLQKTDPASLSSLVAQAQERARRLGVTVGARTTPQSLKRLAEHAVQFGWTDEQLTSQLARLVPKSGAMTGGAATAEDAVDEVLTSYGVKASSTWRNSMVRAVANGNWTTAQVRDYAVGVAKSAWPALAERLDAGETVKSVAAQYVESYAATLEVPPASVSLKDPLIRSALSTVGDDGKPAVQTLWDFEQRLRKDKRWQYTKGAHEELVGTTANVLRSFGLVN